MGATVFRGQARTRMLLPMRVFRFSYGSRGINQNQKTGFSSTATGISKQRLCLILTQRHRNTEVHGELSILNLTYKIIGATVEVRKILGAQRLLKGVDQTGHTIYLA